MVKRSKWRQGEVLWFDISAGEGMILDLEEGTSYYVHSSAIITKSKIKKLSKGRRVKFTLYENLYMKQVEAIEELKAS